MKTFMPFVMVPVMGVAGWQLARLHTPSPAPDVPTIAVGNIFEADHVNTIIAAGRADLCALARPHLADPAWTLHAAAEQGFADIPWPRPYVGSKLQLERNLERAGQLALNA